MDRPYQCSRALPCPGCSSLQLTISLSHLQLSISFSRGKCTPRLLSRVIAPLSDHPAVLQPSPSPNEDARRVAEGASPAASISWTKRTLGSGSSHAQAILLVEAPSYTPLRPRQLATSTSIEALADRRLQECAPVAEDAVLGRGAGLLRQLKVSGNAARGTMGSRGATERPSEVA